MVLRIACFGACLMTSLLSTALSFAEESAPPAAANTLEDARQLARRIDELIAARWKADNITPAPLADDAEFLRRASLDICGRIPAGSEVRDFLADKSPERRQAAIERLLDSPTYIVNMTNRWREVMLPEATSEQEVRFVLPGFEAWLRSRIAENRNFDEIAREIITLPVDQQDVVGFNQPQAPTPTAFYRAKQGKPENLGAATSRLFLGVRLECAQCHDHPFDKWKQGQFWSYAAFFAEFQPMTGEGVAETVQNLLADKRSLRVPETGEVAKVGFLDGEVPEFKDGESTREKLAAWITSPKNPWFARAAANRVWAQLFGTGIVDPPDDFGPNNPPSHPELLDELARSLVAHNYDLKFLMRAIALSETYQRTSRRTDASQDTPRTFARMPVRAMSPEQIFDSLAQATGYLQPFNPEEALDFNNDPARQEFLETFANDSESTTERQSTILQALTLMNGSFVASATDVAPSQTLAAIAEAPFLNDQERVDALFFATLSRPPQPAELERFVGYIKSGGAEADPKLALADVLWALMNSSEFAMNH
jgi:hypothetical protein